MDNYTRINPKAYRFLFLMDPYASLNLETETSLALITELLGRGHGVYWLEESGVFLADGVPHGKISEVTQVQPFITGPVITLPLEDFDALLLRKDPPFDLKYLHLTLMLDQLPARMLQFNSVRALRDFNEKLLPLRWPDLTPETLVTANSNLVLEFIEKHNTVILKPLDDCSGRGILRVQHGEITACQIESYKQSLATPSPYIMAQRFLTEVALGDKRIFLVAGEPVGWVNRIPQSGSFLANIHQGARCEATTLTEFESTAIERIAPFLRQQGIFFAGLDFIGSYLTEINITSPSAIRQISQVMNQKIEVKLVDRMFERLA